MIDAILAASLCPFPCMHDLSDALSDVRCLFRLCAAPPQISAKAYGAARDTNMTLDEAKWVSYKLYRTAKDQFDRQQPPEKRIIEYLCCMADETERLNQLDKAVTPGPTRYTDTHDYLWTTPQRLYRLLDETLKAYEAMRAGAKQAYASSDGSMYPRKIRIMMELRAALVKKYL